MTNEHAVHDVTDAECYYCPSITGEQLHLWWKILDNGSIWACLAESALPAVVFTPGEATELLDGWKRLHRLMLRGHRTSPKVTVTPDQPGSSIPAALVFDLRDGRFAYWRGGETRRDIQLDHAVVADLIAAWEDVCAKAHQIHRRHLIASRSETAS